jgi:hypothetical protein
MKDQILEFLLKCEPKWRARKIKNYPNYIAWLDSEYPNVKLNYQIHSLVTNTSPYCVICNHPIKTTGKLTCSVECRTLYNKPNHTARIEKQKETLIKKYGVDNIRNIEGSESKRKETLLLKYGALVSPATQNAARNRAKDLTIKGRKTLQDRYGVLNPGQLPDHLAKCQQTQLKNSGVTHFTKTDEYQTMMQQRREEKWTLFLPASITFHSIDTNQQKKEIYADPNRVIKFSCNVCNTTEELPTETIKWRITSSGTCCTVCSGISTGSIAQHLIDEFIQGLGFTTITNDKTILHPKHIDILIPDKNLAIEYNGLAFHNELRRGKTYHHDKRVNALAKGIQLIHIFEDEWVHTPDIVKSRLKYLLGCIPTKLYARQCEVKLVSHLQESKFLTANHIQGTDSKSSVKLGLFHNTQLVAMMTFSKPNKSKGYNKQDDTWELLRFCNKIDTTVVGGANKLFQFFIKNYTPSTIITFADLRWSVGKLYQTLGFKYLNNTRINYWYIDLRNVKRIHRFNLRKQSNDATSEYESRLSQGWLRIWDCGSAKFIWSKESPN